MKAEKIRVEKELCFIGDDLVFICYVENAPDPINFAFNELSIERGYKVNDFYSIPTHLRKDIRSACFVGKKERGELSRVIFIVPLEIDKILAGKTKEE